MQPSQVGASLKVARERLGWSREALAYHSGVSWSAIAQIETGRRNDVRLSSLVALAEALDVSVDYLIGVRTSPDLLQHRLLPYASDDELLTRAVPYLVTGVEQAHSVLVVTTPEVTNSLRDTLVNHREQIEFSDWADWYRSPHEALRRYGAFVAEKRKAGGAAWITVVAEAGWAAQSEAEVAAWTRYESLVNLTFASSPATLICTYDERQHSPDALAESHHTHPEILHGDVAATSEAYRTPSDFLLGP